MRPQKNEETLVDVLDVLLRDGAVVRADAIISVAGIPLVGLKLTAALAGMETMNEYGLFEQWDVERRQTAITRRQHKNRKNLERRRSADELDTLSIDGQRDADEE